MINIKKGDLLNATEDAIVHQCNCVTTKSHGLSSLVFEKWPEADLYSQRGKSQRDKPGGIVVKECEDGKIIINLLGQYYPSKSKYPNDSIEKRLMWFKQGLMKIKTHFVDTKRIKSLAFPFKIGCGLAGGNWDDYLLAIQELSKMCDVQISIYKLE